MTAHGKAIHIEASVSSKNANDEEERLKFEVSLVGEQITTEQRINLFDATDETKIGLHVAQKLCTKLGGDLRVACENDQTNFVFYVTFQPSDEVSTMSRTVSRSTLMRQDSSVMQLSHILVLASGVMERLTIKYKLCQELKLGSLVQFTQLKNEAVDAVTTLNTSTDSVFGFAVIIIDI